MTRTLRAIVAVVLTTLLLAILPVSAEASVRPVLRTTSTPVGVVVTGPTGHSVYRFDLDHHGSHRSACAGACLRAWRPVTFAGTAHTRIRLVGVTARAGSIPAAHHRRQVTLAGWPLYYYVGDSAPGQVNGHGSGGVWWPVAPDGSRIKVIPVDPPLNHGTPPGTSYSLSTRTTSLGTIIVNGSGMTVYRFNGDTADDSTCAGCSAVWPPVTGPMTVSGGITGTVTAAPDGQLEINGYRLYTYAYDAAPGDVNGQGSLASWYVVAPSGTEITG